VLDAQRSLFEQSWTRPRPSAATLIWLVRLYKALGGGWPSAPETVAGSETSASGS
jgi:outer membrane protein TolC